MTDDRYISLHKRDEVGLNNKLFSLAALMAEMEIVIILILINLTNKFLAGPIQPCNQGYTNKRKEARGAIFPRVICLFPKAK